jgi:hypothetical protein
MSRRIRVAARTSLALLCFATSLALGPSGSALASPNPVQVSILDHAEVGRFGAAIVTLRARCHAPWLVQGLSVQVSQGAVAGASYGVFDLGCDNAWHVLTVGVSSITGEAFVPGLARVAATLTVVDPVSLEPVGQAEASRTVELIAPAEVVISPHGVVIGSGTGQVFVQTRCQAPWVIQELVVELGQEHTGGLAAGVFGLECDGRWHNRVLRIQPVPTPFERGPATALAFFTILDPVDFDPVWQGQDSETVSLV